MKVHSREEVRQPLFLLPTHGGTTATQCGAKKEEGTGVELTLCFQGDSL